MVLLTSCLYPFSAPGRSQDPFSRSYRVILPSSLTVNHPSASVYSTRPRVSVYGTGGRVLKFSGFSRQHDYQRCRIAPKGAPYCQGRLSARTCLRGSAPTPFNRLFRQAAAVPLLRPRITHTASNGMLTVSAIGIAQRLSLRTRLTPGRLALPGKPWSCGGGASHPPYRYLYLHLPFQTLQTGSRPAFNADWNAPLPIQNVSHGFGNRLHTRLLSMPGPLTSELLRTL